MAGGSHTFNGFRPLHTRRSAVGESGRPHTQRANIFAGFTLIQADGI